MMAYSWDARSRGLSNAKNGSKGKLSTNATFAALYYLNSWVYKVIINCLIEMLGDYLVQLINRSVYPGMTGPLDQ